MTSSSFSKTLSSTRNTSMFAPVIATGSCAAIIILIFSQVHIISVLGTTIAATIAATATFTRSYYRTNKYIRFAIRARLAKRAEPEFEKLARSIRGSKLENYVPTSSHPSPEIQEALYEAERRMGLRRGTTMALVVPLELILGVPHNCPSAAAMLYSSRHPVVLIDDHLQMLLDDHDNYEQNYSIVVSVLCHELAHLIGWNTRWSKLVSISELFVTTAAMASIVAYGLEHNLTFGLIGAIITAIYLALEPAAHDDEDISNTAIVARIALFFWIPYVIVGIIISILPLVLALGVTIITLGLRSILAYLRRKEELYADTLAANALGSSAPLTDFFRTLSSDTQTIFSILFSTHPPVSVRIKNLRKIKFR